MAEEAHAPAVRFALPFAGQQVFADDVELQVEVSHFQIPAPPAGAQRALRALARGRLDESYGDEAIV